MNNLLSRTVLVLCLGSLSGCLANKDASSPTTIPPDINKLTGIPSELVSTPTGYACIDLGADVLSDLDYSSVTGASQLLAWVQRQPRFAQFDERQDTDGEVVWKNRSRYYFAAFDTGPLRSIGMQWTAEQPASIELILSCYGAPQYYEAYNYPAAEDMPGGVIVYLWYPEQGLVFGHSSSPPKRSGEVRPDSTVMRAYLFQPSGVDQAIRKVYHSVQSAEIEKRLKSVRPWPGALEKITVDNQQLAP